MNSWFKRSEVNRSVWIIPNICDDETAAQIARFDPIDDCFSNLPEKHVKSLFDYVQNDDKCLYKVC